MTAINELHKLHHPGAFSDCTLWDPWLPHATLWTGQRTRDQYRASLLNRKIDGEGYVSVNQHRGMAHSEGWPFSAWQQSGGAGFHFWIADEFFAIHNFSQQAITNSDGWEINGASVEGIDPVQGVRLKATSDVVTITSPAFRCGTIVAPFARLEWAASGLGKEAKPNIQWLFDGEFESKGERHVEFPPLSESDGLRFANVPMYRHPGYGGTDSVVLWLKPSLWSMTSVDANGNITHEEEIVRTVTAFNFKPTIGQTYTFKDQKKK